MAVAGYPEVDVATRPFDWPMLKKSVDALRISKNLDDITGMHEFTSLRSSLLNRDLRFRIDSSRSKSEMRRAHRECLLLLFARTRQLDDVPLNQSYYRSEEEGLLTQLHGKDNNRRGDCWPNLDELEKYEESLGAEPLKPDMKKIGEETGGDGPDWDRAKAANNEWIEWRDLGGPFSLGDLEVEEVAFQYHYVQSWLTKVVPTQKHLGGTVQRFLRGASLLLELSVSEARQRIAEKIGIGAITVDGGGRVVFLCPKDKDKIEDMQRYLRKSVWQFLSSIMRKDEEDERQHSRAGNHIRFERTLENWANACFKVGHKKGGRVVPRRDEPPHKQDQHDYEEWFRQIQSMLPPISIPELGRGHEEEAISPSSKDEVVAALNAFKPPKITKGENSHSPMDDCLFCNNKPISKEMGDKMDSLMGLEGKGNPIPEICPFHRLLYHIGHDQRVKDSTLRPSPAHPDEKAMVGSSKPTTAVAQLDGNSLGIIFTERYKEVFTGEELLDRKRRRSFRFNYQWWYSIQKAVDEHGSGDRVAAWVTAGDDVLLAQYDWKLDKEVFVGRDQELLEDTLRDLAENIEIGVSEELPEGMFLSFAAGLAIKRPEGERDRIQQQLERVRDLERHAKNRWKTKASKEWVAMITRPSGDLVEYDTDRGEGVDWILGTRSNMVFEPIKCNRCRSGMRWDETRGEFVCEDCGQQCNECGSGMLWGETRGEFVCEDCGQQDASTDTGDGRFKSDNFNGWTPDLVKQAIDELGLDGADLSALTSDLMRHYIEKRRESVKLVVLPPKKKKRGM
jgi:predicted RNA-binding Zn-ribbon protein involved in translation (DUF1610 family)